MPIFEQKPIRPDRLQLYLEDMGAATIKEIKEHFGVDSKSTRLSLFKLGLRPDVNLVVMGGQPPGTTYWFNWPTDKRGKPSPMKMRIEAETRRKKKAIKQARRLKKVKRRASQPEEVDFSRDE